MKTKSVSGEERSMCIGWTLRQARSIQPLLLLGLLQGRR